MIELNYKAEFDKSAGPFVVKLLNDVTGESNRAFDKRNLAEFKRNPKGVVECTSEFGSFRFATSQEEAINGDVVLCVPNANLVHRLYRRNSVHNTFLFTERCDQLCVMCSQPPKNSNDAWKFPVYEQVLKLVDNGVVIGISGGEPTLYKDQLFTMMENASVDRPDIRYHILSNGQHFDLDDRTRLTELHRKINIQWGIPLYSNDRATHEEIVSKCGAFDRVMENLYLLASTGAMVELRTVVTAMNVHDLPALASFIGNHIPFISVWAIMGMEPIGYAKANMKQLFYDHTAFPTPIVTALDMAEMRGIASMLFNIPLCSMPPTHRKFCADSISDWKKKYLPECGPCRVRNRCTGFFEWYNEDSEWEGVKPILEGDRDETEEIRRS